jgi:tight adherence protein C
MSIWLFVTAFGLAIAVALYAALAERQRRVFIRRAQGAPSGMVEVRSASGARRTAGMERVLREVQALGRRLPAPLFGTGLARTLACAGFDQPAAPAVYAGIQLLWGALVVAIGLVVAPRDDMVSYSLSLMLAVALAVFTPRAVLDRLIAARQHRIRLGVPDALDLLVVCIEAGTALDASLQRVAREMVTMHPALAGELTVMTRRMSAGVSRADALTLLHERTGVSELRSLATHLIQSERWGTSVAAVLRIYARDLRRKRRLVAEKRAATAGTRMLFPLALFIFPTIFIVILGPAILQIGAAFRGMAR